MTRSNQSRRRLPEWVFVSALALVALLGFLWGTREPRAVPPPSPLVITELAASGPAGLRDEDGEHHGWIEIANFGAGPEALAGWCLTDNFREPARWRFPDVQLAPGKRLVVFASGKDRRDPTRPLHTNFKLNERGEYLALVKPDGRTVAQEFFPKYPRQRGLVTYGLREGLQLGEARAGLPAGAYAYFDHPTPGAANTGEVRGLVSEVRASAAGSVLSSPLTVSLVTRTPEAQILYTTNGSAPSETNGLVYRHPLRINTTTVLRAAAYRPGFAPTEVLTRSFLFPAQVAGQTGASFPKFWGFTNGQPVAAFYAMDHRIADSADYHDDLLKGLTALPSVSIVTELENLFDSERGIMRIRWKTGATGSDQPRRS